METFTPIPALIGGALIGLSAPLLLLFHGRVAGVSGILGETLRGAGTRGEDSYRIAFLGGLLGAGVMLRVAYPGAFATTFGTSASLLPIVAGAGLLVGYGTRLGNGCTSGHVYVGSADSRSDPS